MRSEGEDLQDDGADEDDRRWYQRPWLTSFDGFNWTPTSWGALAALLVIVVLGVVAINWIGSLF